MVKKSVKVLLLTLAIFAVIPVCVMAKTDLVTKLDGIEKDIANLKSEYTSILTTHSDVIDSLSEENKEIINDLSSNILSSNIAEKVNAIKTELESSSDEGATDVLNAINKLEVDAKKLIDENKDVLNELKDEYSSLSGEQLKEVVRKVKDIMLSVGIKQDSKEAYDKIINVFDDAHEIMLDINTKIDNVLKNNVSKFSELLTIEVVDNVLTYTQNKDMEKVIDTLLESIDNVSKADELKEELSSIKNEIGKLENKLNEFDSLDVQDIIMLKDSEVKGISDKLNLIEKDYIDFVKVIINKYADVYLKVAFDKSKNVSIDKMIDYANKALDIIVEREAIVDGLGNNRLPKELISKAGILVALGALDFSSYDKEYINANFNEEVDKIATFLIDEMLGYIDSIDSAMKKEVKDSIANGENPDLSQDKVIYINVGRFATVENLKKLQARVEEELLSTQEKLKEKLSKYAPRVYDIFNINILDTIETIMSLENEKTSRVYEYNAVYSYIVTDTFIEGKDFAKTIGIPEKNQGILEGTNLADEILKTGSKVRISLSENVYQTYNYAVLGDVYADGMIDARDYMAIKNHVMAYSTLGEINQIAANTYRDTLIDSRDYMKIKNEIMDAVNKEITLGGN